MAFLFWLLWSIDLIIALFTIIAKRFRGSFTSSDHTWWFDLLIIGSVVGSFLLRLAFRRPSLALIVAALPLLILLVWYFTDSEKIV